MKRQLIDRKNGLVYAVWSTVNKLILRTRFNTFEIIGRENIPEKGAFMLVSNHITRWDGLLVYELINRPSNFMVHPNELVGFQGTVLMSMGAFPSNPRFDLKAHVLSQLQKGEGVVIFTEGNIFRDGHTHPFKKGAARFALDSAQSGLDVPLIPIAIQYDDVRNVARVMVGQPVELAQYAEEFSHTPTEAVATLTERLQREVGHLRLALGNLNERVVLFASKPLRAWAKHAVMQ